MAATGAHTSGLSHQEEKKLGIHMMFYPSLSAISIHIISRLPERMYITWAWSGSLKNVPQITAGPLGFMVLPILPILLLRLLQRDNFKPR
jgi:hypothetical protein